MKLILKVITSAFVIGATACTFTIPTGSEDENENTIPFGTIEPDLDYSNETPDCFTAAQRIEDYVVEGMTLADVRRLVGQPRVILPGTWYWTAGFTREGRPAVYYAFGPADDDVPVKSTSTATNLC